MKTFLVLFTIITFAFCGCRCPSGNCDSRSGYSGTDAQCFCWCSQTAHSLRLGSDARCTYAPKSTFSAGVCALCSNSIKYPIETIFSSSDLVQTVEPSTYNPNLFPVRRCLCPGDCSWAYSGTYDQCLSFARLYAGKFLNSQYTVTYFPRSTYSAGGCTVCGQVDSCKA
ncbi:hypothetical protein RCL1_007451 [Eukaryota sp. TZLM3-RCL]